MRFRCTFQVHQPCNQLHVLQAKETVFSTPLIHSTNIYDCCCVLGHQKREWGLNYLSNCVSFSCPFNAPSLSISVFLITLNVLSIYRFHEKLQNQGEVPLTFYPGQIQLIYIFHGFHLYKFSYSLEVFCNRKISTCGSFEVIHGHM